MAQPTIPKTHKACIYDKIGQISTKVVEVETPLPGPGEVLIRLSHSSCCHSDLGIMTGSWKFLPEQTIDGQIGGHEGVGKIVALGPGVQETEKTAIGKRVGVKWISGACLSCDACIEGREVLCFNMKISGYFTPGTFQQYVLGPANYVTPIPDNLDSTSAAPMLCAGVTVYAAIRKSEAKAGNWIVISASSGGLGHIACQIASKAFGMRVIGIDHGSKKELSLQSGAEHFIDYTTSKDLGADVKALTNGRGSHAVLVLTAANAAYSAALTMLRIGGVCVCVGLPEQDMIPIATAYPALIVEQELKIVGSSVGTRQEAIETLDLAARGVIKTHYELAKMEDLADVFERMHEGKIAGRVVLDLE